MSEPRATHLTFDDGMMWVHLVDGRVLPVPLDAFPSLLNAGAAQRASYLISGAGIGLHWDALNEDISVPHLARQYGDGKAGAASVAA